MAVETVDPKDLVERIQRFMAGAELSRTSMARVLSLSTMTLKRWFDGDQSMDWVYNAAERKMDILEEAQKSENLFYKLHGRKQGEKVDQLVGVLYRNLDWQ